MRRHLRHFSRYSATQSNATSFTGDSRSLRFPDFLRLFIHSCPEITSVEVSSSFPTIAFISSSKSIQLRLSRPAMVSELPIPLHLPHVEHISKNGVGHSLTLCAASKAFNTTKRYNIGRPCQFQCLFWYVERNLGHYGVWRQYMFASSRREAELLQMEWIFPSSDQFLPVHGLCQSKKLDLPQTQIHAHHDSYNMLHWKLSAKQCFLLIFVFGVMVVCQLVYGLNAQCSHILKDLYNTSSLFHMK